MPKKYLKYIIFPVLLSCLVFSYVNLVLAADTLLIETNQTSCSADCGDDANCKQYCGDYGIDDFAAIIIKVSTIILGVVGSLALLAFVAGGVMLLVSSGNKNWIDRGKATLIGAVIGLAIVFLSYTIISLVFTSMGVEPDWTSSNWFQ